MAIHTRHYLVEDDGALKRVARRIVNGLIFGADSLPAYAGTRQRVAEVLVESEDGRPVRILDVTGSWWAFDEEGRIDASLRRATAEWLDYAYASRPQREGGRVVSLVPELKRKELEAKHRWPVSQEIVARIAADIWPGIHGPAPDVGAVKGTAPRRPPLLWQAKDVLLAIGRNVGQVDDQLGSLSEPGLRGLEFEVERHATMENAALWKGVAGHARHRRAILAANRTGRGEWYAVVTAMRREREHRDRVVATAYVKRKGRDEAVAAGRALLVEKADWLGPDTDVFVVIYSALEWQPGEE